MRPLHRGPRLAQPLAVGVADLALAVAADDVHRASPLAGQLDEPVGQLLLLDDQDLLRRPPGPEHDRPVLLDVVLAGEVGLAIRVGHRPREAAVRVARVLLEQVLGHLLARLI